MQPFAEMSQEDQLAYIQSLVPQFAAEFELDVKDIENVNLGFNASFKVTTKSNQIFAFRININSKKEAQELAAESQWLRRLADLDSIEAPTPLQARSGEFFASVWSDHLEKDLLCLGYAWIEGTIPGEDPTKEDYLQIGRNMAHLHNSTLDWMPTGSASMPHLNTTLMSSTSNYPDNRIDDELYAMIQDLMTASNKVHERLSAESALQPIHADLHAENVVRKPDGIQAVIDFDDCGIGFPLQDFAISSFYLRDESPFEEYVFEGYSEVRPVPAFSQEDFELLVISRQIVLLNDLLQVTTAEEREFVPTYLEYTRKRFQHFYETGVFKLIRD
jgi:Ser/Thr protein kinase RdoA (MazF antagonist)